MPPEPVEYLRANPGTGQTTDNRCLSLGAQMALQTITEVFTKAEGYAWVNFYVGAKTAQFA
eukprot:2049963-Prorocentrum_lima.AAC.1